MIFPGGSEWFQDFQLLRNYRVSEDLYYWFIRFFCDCIDSDVTTNNLRGTQYILNYNPVHSVYILYFRVSSEYEPLMISVCRSEFRKLSRYHNHLIYYIWFPITPHCSILGSSFLASGRQSILFTKNISFRAFHSVRDATVVRWSRNLCSLSLGLRQRENG